MVLIGILFFTVSAETHAEVREILLGNWSVSSEVPSGESFLAVPESFHLRILPPSDVSQIILMTYNTPIATEPLLNLTAIFAPNSKGTFVLHEELRPIAEFDFSPILPPHISSFGDWNQTLTFSALMITNRWMQLTLFEKEGNRWTVFNFQKEVGDGQPNFFEKHFQMIVMIVVFIGSVGVSMLVQKYYAAKTRREAEKLLEAASE
jgi:hypothetical protein